MVKGEWSFTHFQDHLSFVAIADAAGAASGNTTAEVPEADASPPRLLARASCSAALRIAFTARERIAPPSASLTPSYPAARSSVESWGETERAG